MNIAEVDHWANNHHSFLHRASAISKLVATAWVIAAVVIANDAFGLVTAYLILAGAAVLTELPWRRLLTVAAYPMIFALLFAWSQYHGNWVGPGIIIGKTMVAALAMVLNIASTPYPRIFAALTPVLPGFVRDAFFLTYRGVFVLLELFENLIRNVRLRCGLPPRRLLQNAGNLATAMGVVVVRSVDMSQRVYDIMRLRGYTGHMAGSDVWRQSTRQDVVPIVGGLLIFCILLGLRSWWWIFVPITGFLLVGACAFFCVSLGVHWSRVRGGRKDARNYSR